MSLLTVSRIPMGSPPGRPPPHVGARQGVLGTLLGRPIAPIQVGEIPADRGAVPPPQLLPEGLTTQREQALAATPRLAAVTARGTAALGFCRRQMCTQHERDQRRQSQPRHQMLLMRQIAHLAGFPAPPARLSVAEQRFNRGSLAIDRNQIPAQRQTAHQHLGFLVGCPPQRHEPGRTPTGILKHLSLAFPAIPALGDLLDHRLDASLTIAPARLALHSHQPIPAVRWRLIGQHGTAEGPIRHDHHSCIRLQHLGRLV